MKKSLIALAVAGAFVAPMVAQADATLYGLVKAELQGQKDQDVDLHLHHIYLGVKGSQETNFEGVTAIYQIETELASDSNDGVEKFGSERTQVGTRLAYAGLTGGFGTVLAGRIANPTDAIENYTDLGNQGDLLADSNPDRLGSALAYVTPTWNGFSGYFGLVMDANASTDNNASADHDYDDGDDMDGYLLGVSYNNGPLSLGLGGWHFSDDSSVSGESLDGNGAGVGDEDLTKYLLGGSYTFMDALTVGFTYEHNNFTLSPFAGTDTESNGAFTQEYTEYQTPVSQEDSELFSLAASYKAGNFTPYIELSKVDSDAKFEGDSDFYDADEWVIGSSYALGPKVETGIEFSQTSYDAHGKDDYNQWNIWYTVKF